MKKCSPTDLTDKNKIMFWREVCRLMGKHKNVLTCIHGKNYEKITTRLFAAGYKQFLNDCEDSSMLKHSQHNANIQPGFHLCR